jgi:two-component system chemotaxis sensor kinase CheA
LDDSILDEFLVDSHEGLDRLDRDLVMLEHDPSSREGIASAFRALHTIKGTCSFFGFRRLERVAHAGESLLSRLRSGRLAPEPAITAGLLAVVDAVRGILAGIESTRREADGDDSAVLARLAPWLEGAPAATMPQPPGLGASARGGRRPVPAKRAPEVPEPAHAEAETLEPAYTATALQQQHVRVDVRRLDQIMDLVGELVLARNQLVRTLAALPRSEASPGATPVAMAAQRVDQVTTRLQDEVVRTRMQPVSALWARLPRLVRDVAAACGKTVRLEMQGNATELDRTLVEALKDPITHLVRNAVDHGIESADARHAAGKPAEGVLRLRAFQEGGGVHLLLSDDGAGMSFEKIREHAIARGLADASRAERLTEKHWLQFVFLPGFSTASKVTSISGRGVGLDAARAAIESVGGTIEVATVRGQGTTFHVRLPLTLAIIPALTVEQSGECYAIPQAHVLELVRVAMAPSRTDDSPAATTASGIERAHDRLVYRLRGELLPVVLLGQVLECAEAASPAAHLLVLSAEGQKFGLAVERVRDTEEIVVKPLRQRLREGGLFAGATVRGDGRVALILDVPSLAARAGLELGSRALGDGGAAPTPAAAASTGEPSRRAEHMPLLLVRSRGGLPVAVRVAEVDRIVEFEPDAFERFGDRPAVRLDGEVLPVASLAGDPALGSRESLGENRTWPVLIHTQSHVRMGLIVDAVEDILDWEGSPADRIVVRDRVTDLVTLSGGPR